MTLKHNNLESKSNSEGIFATLLFVIKIIVMTNHKWFISQKDKRSKKRIFRPLLWETFLSVKTEVGMFTR